MLRLFYLDFVLVLQGYSTDDDVTSECENLIGPCRCIIVALIALFMCALKTIRHKTDQRKGHTVPRRWVRERRVSYARDRDETSRVLFVVRCQQVIRLFSKRENSFTTVAVILNCHLGVLIVQNC